MFLFHRHKKISHKQASLIGFVLAVMSLLSSVLVVTLGSLFAGWLYAQGLFGLDVYLMPVAVTIFFAIQGLLLFGFPLYYAQDKKSHMTGFQILIYALMWLVLLVVGLGALAVALNSTGGAPVVPVY
jgi:hypothetical protein